MYILDVNTFGIFERSICRHTNSSLAQVLSVHRLQLDEIETRLMWEIYFFSVRISHRRCVVDWLLIDNNAEIYSFIDCLVIRLVGGCRKVYKIPVVVVVDGNNLVIKQFLLGQTSAQRILWTRHSLDASLKSIPFRSCFPRKFPFFPVSLRDGDKYGKPHVHLMMAPSLPFYILNFRFVLGSSLT